MRINFQSTKKEHTMIKLYSFGPAFNLIDASPFVTKIDLFLRVNDISFESVPNVDNLQKSPKGKLPYIKDGNQIIADSTAIIEYLASHHNASIDAWLSDEQKATSHLISKSLDENLYWCLVHSRWVHEATWQIVKANYFDSMSFPMNKIVPIVARKQVRGSLKGHGMGKHTEDEITHIAQQSFQSLSTLLADKPYFFGEKISSLDIVIFSHVASFTLASINNPLNELARTFDNLVAFTQKTQNQYYPDL